MPSYAEWVRNTHKRPTAPGEGLERLVFVRSLVDRGVLGEWSGDYNPAGSARTSPNLAPTPLPPCVSPEEVTAWGHDLVEKVAALRAICDTLLKLKQHYIPYRITRVDWSNTVQANLFVADPNFETGYILTAVEGETADEALQRLGQQILDHDALLAEYAFKRAEARRAHR